MLSEKSPCLRKLFPHHRHIRHIILLMKIKEVLAKMLNPFSSYPPWPVLAKFTTATCQSCCQDPQVHTPALADISAKMRDLGKRGIITLPVCVCVCVCACDREGDGEDKRETERILSRLCTVNSEPHAGLDLMTVRS